MNSSSSAAAAAADAINAGEIIFEIPDSIRIYRSGRLEGLLQDLLVPPSLDPLTQVQSKDILINPTTGLSARLYLPPSVKTKIPILISIHGGGFCLLRSSSSIYQTFINPLTANSRVLTVSIDYRLAPETPLPAAYNDCWEALQWVFTAADPWLSEIGDFDRVFLSGESAGANIVHNLCMRLGTAGLKLKVEGIMLLHPYFWGEQRIGNEVGDLVNERKVEATGLLWRSVCPGTTGLDDPLINPTAEGAPSLRDLGCRRVLVCVAELDLLRDRGLDYVEKLKESGWGGLAELFESEGVDHGFFFRLVGVKTEELRERMVNFINSSSSIGVSD